MNVNGGSINKITTNEGNDSNPIWVSDDELVYISCKSGNYGIYKNNLLGTAEDLVVDFATDNKLFARTPVWSKPASLLAYEKNGSIYTISSGGGTETLISSGSNNSSPNWSADGEKIVYSSSSELKIYVLGHDTPNTLTTASVFQSIHWSPDGNKLAFIENHTLYTINSDGTGKSAILSRLYSEESICGWFDNSWIFCMLQYQDSDRPNIYAIRSDGRFPTRLVFHNNAQLTSWCNNQLP